MLNFHENNHDSNTSDDSPTKTHTRATNERRNHTSELPHIGYPFAGANQ